MVLNANKAFSAAKNKTQMIKKVPGCVRDAFNIDSAEQNGIFKIEPGNGLCLYDRCYIFEDINYINQDEDVKERTLLQLAAWLNSMKVEFKVTAVAERQDVKQFIKEIFIDKNGGKYPDIQEGIGQWINEKADEGDQDIKEIMYLTISCRARSYEDAKIYFNGLDTHLHAMFGIWKSRLYRLSGWERLRCLYRIMNQKREGQFHVPKQAVNRNNTEWKNDIFPGTIDSYENFMIFDDTLYVSVLYGKSYATSLDEGQFMHTFLTMPFPNIVTLDYAPVEKPVLENKLSAAHMNNEKAISDEVDVKRNNGQLTTGVSYMKGKRKDELEEYRDQVADNDEKAFFLGFLVVVFAFDEEELSQRVERVQTLGDTAGVTMDTYNHKQLKAFNTALPFAGRQVNCMRSLLTSSIVAFHPYYAQDLQEVGGICYGLNETTKRLIIGNRKKLDGPHGMIVSPTGKGKSMLIKMTEISQTLITTDDDVWIIDPQNEFSDIVEDYGGQFFDFTPKSDMHLNPFEIPVGVFESDYGTKQKFIAVQKDYAKSFCSSTMIGIEANSLHYKFICRVIQEMYEEAFAQKRLKKQPSLKEFYRRLGDLVEAQTGEDKQITKEVYNSLSEYVDGSYDMFAFLSNISISRRLVAFGMKNVPENLWEPVMLTIMHYLDVQVDYNQENHKAIRLIVDEAQVVCKNKMSADRLLHAIITFRKYGGIVTMALQNLTRIAENPDLRDMFSNCEYKCFLNLKNQDARTLEEIQELSTDEFNSINNSSTGCGLMVWGDKIIKFNAYMNKENPLYDKFSTNFHEKAEQAKEKEGGEKVDQKEKERQEKEISQLLYAASMAPLTVEDAMAVLSVPEESAKKLLNYLCDQKLLEASMETGTLQYQKVG